MSPFCHVAARVCVILLTVCAAPQALWANDYDVWAPGLQDTVMLDNRLQSLAASATDVDEIAIAPTGDWVIITAPTSTGSAVYFSPFFNSLCLGQIFTFTSQGKHIDVVAFAPNGSFVVVAEDLYFLSGGVPDAAQLEAEIQGRIAVNERVTDIAFTSNGLGWSFIAGSYVVQNGVPQAFFDAVLDRRDSRRTIQGIAFGSSDRWVVYADQRVATRFVNDALLSAARNWQASRIRIDHMKIGPGNSHIMYSNGIKSADMSNPAERIEYGLLGGLSNIFRRMQDSNIVGLSFAVVDQNQVVYARGYGDLENGTQRAVLASSPFDVASLAKYIAALGIMKLAEAGILTLSTDAYVIASQAAPTNQLYLWKSFAEALPQVFGNPAVALPQGLTLRRLLSHSASMEPWGSPGFLVSNWPESDPAMFQLLLGLGCGSSGCGWSSGRVVWSNPSLGAPGMGSRYSGGGFLVAQAVAERRAGQTFSTIQQQRVLTPLGMNDSRYVLRPPDAAFEEMAAAHHDSLGVPLERAVYPWAAAGGLYASPRDYAKALIPLLNQGALANGTPYLSPFGLFLMMQDAAPGSTNYGLGLSLSQPIVGESGGAFSHSGSHSNRAYALMEGTPSIDSAFVVTVSCASAACKQVAREVMEAYRCAYGTSTSGCL